MSSIESTNGKSAVVPGSRLEWHLQWLISLMQSEYAEGWKHWVWHRAKELAADPELAELPVLLTAALRSTPSPSSAPTDGA